MREMQELVPGTKREEFVLASSKKLCGNKQSKHLNLEHQSQVCSAKWVIFTARTYLKSNMTAVLIFIKN